MIDRLYTVSAAGFDPTVNLAAESAFLDRVRKNELILYLWQNDNTIVIGRNQNKYRECNLRNIEKDHVHLVRRMSGGGAVYHDTGNLNFTFITDDENYSVERQSEVILRALAKRGLRAEISGRNDLLMQGMKFSGNAYYHHHGFSYHHGTLLISSDLTKMPQYLNPDPLKLSANGVSSVRSRVCRLNEFDPELDVRIMKKLLIEACEEVYGVRHTEMQFPAEEEIKEYIDLYRSREWIDGKNPPFDLKFEKRFSWGGIEIGFHVVKGIVKECMICSDSMEPDEIDEMSRLLTGCVFEKDALIRKLEIPDSAIAYDVRLWLKDLEL